MRIAICEDDSYFLNYSSKIIQACFAAYQPDCVIDSFSDSSILFKTLTSHNLHYDVLFLDIDMPQIDGITIGSFLKKAEADAFIIYLSGREDLVFDTFETRPFSFLPKNQFQQKIRSTVASVCIACQQKQTLVSFFIGGTHYQWDLKKLVYIECCNKTIYLHFTDYALELCYQLSALEQKLTNYGFIRVHKGSLVNYRFIFCIEKNFILLDTQEQIPLSKHRATYVKKEFIRLTV